MSDATHTTARELVAPGKGILAADESTGTIKKRFDQIGVGSTEDLRRRYRQMLFTTPGLGEHISGVILFDETIRQASDDGVPFVKVLEAAGSIPGIKVDTGAKPLALFPGETVTEGLDGLRERLAEYAELGARFAKWRATILIGEGIPTDFAIWRTRTPWRATRPSVRRRTSCRSWSRRSSWTAPTTSRRVRTPPAGPSTRLFRQMHEHRIDLPGSLLKVNMIVPGKDSPTQVTDREIAEATIRCLTAHVPATLPGIVFLSGGMSDEEATNRLNEMNKIGGFPWQLSFSYGRALQHPALIAWGGDEANVASWSGRSRAPREDERPSAERRLRPVARSRRPEARER